MKRGFQLLILTAILISFLNCEKKANDILYDSRYKKEIAELRKEASLYLMLNNIPGASFAIAKEGKIIYSEGMGLASKDLEVPATRKTKFRIGEVSELFTSLMYQMMGENGTVHPDSTVQHYLPDFPLSDFKQTLNKITLSQLVNHSSGIREPGDDEFIWKGQNFTLQSSIDNFKNDPLNSIPGWYENPSTYNYNLLGAVMEKASGKTYPDLLKEYITDTLKLTNTEVDNPFRTITGRTDFFDYNLVSQVVNATFRDMRYRAPSEGILSNAEDLVKLGNAILYSDLISNQIKERLFKPIDLLGDFPPTMANGWVILKSKEGDFMYGRVGGVTGGGAVLLIIPDEKLVIAGTVNLTSSDEIPVFKMIAPFLKDTNKKEQVNEKQK
ncbi:MAG TPA: serine hydrolase domain-containing protein [Draconibacterium sp.]|nr:serine hydrolase domain-containing protein [Draconibacterium sp.]